jgi:hypothetical protein
MPVFSTWLGQDRITWGNPHKWCSDSLPYLKGHYRYTLLKSPRPIKDVGGRKCRRPDSYYLGSAESLTSDSFSVRLKSSLSDGVDSPPCSPQVESALRPAQLIWAASLPYCTGCCTGMTCLNVCAHQMFTAADILTLFLGKIKNLTRLISVLSLPIKFVHNHKSCPYSAASLLSL